MGNLEKIRSFLQPIVQSVKSHYEDSRSKAAEKECQRLAAERALRIQAQQDEIQCELAQVFQHSHYTNLVQINSVTDLRQNGYKDNGNGIIYSNFPHQKWDSYLEKSML